jgi:2-polyprenyl-6-methoxyphenol hydroxylase-like FAD-dependent oxidoreductase
MTPGCNGHVAGALPFSAADHVWARIGSPVCACPLRTLDGTVDGGAGDAEQFGELCGGVLAGGVHLAGIAAHNDKALAVFMFRSRWIDYDYHDLAAQKQILADAFAGHSQWRVPELVDAAIRDPELYFDSVSQIQMPAWHLGPVVLVGDAAHCTSNLTGRGTSLALTDAWFLARALRDYPGDIAQAWEQYDRNQRPLATKIQAIAAPGGDRLVPATQYQIDARCAHAEVRQRGGRLH